MKKLKIEDITWSIEALPEDTPVRGNAMASDDPVFDKQIEDKILKDMEWNEWAWCCVKVTGRWNGLEQDDYLGSCSYESKQDFIDGGYYQDMQYEVLTRLQNDCEKIYKELTYDR